jgi:transposase-like protein
MPWKTMDVREQKVKFVVAASRREKSLTALCQEFGISRPTGLLWRKRYEEKGVAGIAERSRRMSTENCEQHRWKERPLGAAEHDVLEDL